MCSFVVPKNGHRKHTNIRANLNTSSVSTLGYLGFFSDVFGVLPARDETPYNHGETTFPWIQLTSQATPVTTPTVPSCIGSAKIAFGMQPNRKLTRIPGSVSRRGVSPCFCWCCGKGCLSLGNEYCGGEEDKGNLQIPLDLTVEVCCFEDDLDAYW